MALTRHTGKQVPGTCILGWQQKSRSNEILIEYYYCHTANALLLARHPPSILGHRLGEQVREAPASVTLGNMYLT